MSEHSEAPFTELSGPFALTPPLPQGEGLYLGLVLLCTEDFPAVKVTFLEIFAGVKCHISNFEQYICLPSFGLEA